MRPEGLLLDDTDLKYYFETAITTLVATHFNCNSYFNLIQNKLKQQQETNFVSGFMIHDFPMTSSANSVRRRRICFKD